MSQEMAKAVDQLFAQDPQDEVSGSLTNGISFVKSRSEAAGFPKGWYREELVKSGVGVVNPGQKIIHYFSPDGRKFRTKAELARFFGVRLDLSNFDFKSGRIHAAYGNSNFKKNQQKINTALKNGSGSSFGSSVTLQKFLEPPVRQCTCILNQKVRSIETCGPNVSMKDGKDARPSFPRNAKPKPVQVFWAKRLDGIVAVDADSDLKLTPQLPRGFKSAASSISENAALISLAATLYNVNVLGGGVTLGGEEPSAPLGQPEKMRTNAAYILPYQPLIAATKVTPMLIEEQELQVQRLRQDLAKMLSRQQKERS